eukprot:scaffold117533_cov54-Phaeocystis_antarctica.AAC.1
MSRQASACCHVARGEVRCLFRCALSPLAVVASGCCWAGPSVWAARRVRVGVGPAPRRAHPMAPG